VNGVDASKKNNAGTGEREMELDEKMIMPAAVPGLSAFGPKFEQLIDGLQGELSKQAAGEVPTRLGIQPVIPRSIVERAGYVEAFPHLLGTVHTYEGDDREWRRLAKEMEAGRDWSAEHRMSDVVVLPAVCYQVYPQLEGARLERPCLFDISGYCYRHERSHEPGRMRSFRMREFVRVGDAKRVREWREAWLERGREWLCSLGLDVSVEAATDPFFGGAARLMQPLQEREQLKWELVTKVDGETRQAVASSNYHKDHFGSTFQIEAGGETAHSACAAFGLERIALAVLNAHGENPTDWPFSTSAGEVVGV
jgi:seryl-tRNA synthetase